MNNKSVQHARKRVAASLLLLAFANLSMPVLADTVVTTGAVLNQVGGQYGADLQNVTGATVTTNYTNATVTTQAGNNSVLNWNNLNTAPTQGLNYKFEGANQFSLNNVVGKNISQFAGSLTSEGNGRIIISNPNGIIFENGSYTNVNALTLTTHKVNENNINSFNANGNIASIKIGGFGGNAAVMRIAEDLNIISNGINIENADILANNVKLITADGVNFISTTGDVDDFTNIKTTNFDTINSDNEKISSSILVKDSAIAVRDNSNGKLYFIAKGDNTKANIAAINSALNAKIKMNVDGNADFEVIGNLNIADSTIGGNLIAKTLENGSLTLENTKANKYTSTTTLEKFMKDNNLLSDVPVYDWKWVGKDKNKTSKPNYTPDGIGEKVYKKWSWSEYWVSYQSGTEQKITVDDIKNLLNVDTTEANKILQGHLNDTYISKTKTSNLNTLTKALGQGSVSIADSSIGGKLTALGSKIDLTNVSAKNVLATTVQGSDVSYSISDTTSYKVDEITNKWVPEYDIIYQNGKWVVAEYHEAELFDGKFGPYWTYQNENGKTEKVRIWFNDVIDDTVASAFEATEPEKLISVSNTFTYSGPNSSVLDNSININNLTVKDDLKTISLNNTTIANNTNAGNLDSVSKGNLTVKNSKFNKIKAAAADITFSYTDINTGKEDGDGILATNKIVVNSNKTTKISNSLLKANNSITANSANIENSKLNSKTITASKATVKGSTLDATNDINVGGTSKLYDSTLIAGKKINLNGDGNYKGNGATLDNTNVTLRDGANINKNEFVILSNATLKNNSSVVSSTRIMSGNVTLDNSKITAKLGDITLADKLDVNGKIINTKNKILGNSTIDAINGSVYIYNTDGAGNLKTSALNDIKISNSTLGDVIANSTNSGNINVNSSTKANSLNLTTGGDITVTTISNVSGLLKAVGNKVTVNGITDSIGSLDLKSSGDLMINNAKVLGTSNLNSDKTITIKNKSNLLGDVIANAVDNISIGNSALSKVTATSNKDLIANAVTVSAPLVANAKNATITNSSLSDATINSTVKSDITNSTIANLNISNTGDLNITDTKMNSLRTTNSGNINLQGVNIANDLNITNANNVKISNSNATPDVSVPTIADLATGKKPITDYNEAKYTSAFFESILATQGSPYGEGQRISYIGGNASITDVNNIDIINTAVINDLNTLNYAGEQNLITSYVGGAFTPDRTTTNETSVYQSYIVQPYTPYYMVDETYQDDINKLKYGNPLDTSFQRQFNVKGFAAADDQIRERMNKTLSSARPNKGNSIRINEAFIAE